MNLNVNANVNRLAIYAFGLILFFLLLSGFQISRNSIEFNFIVCFRRFCLAIKPGGLIRVHTSVLQPTSLYKSLVISEETTSDELLILLLSCCSSSEPVEQFSIYEVSVQCSFVCKLFSVLRTITHLHK